ncbi:hypothetical protein [Sinimarinibacterium flocculans]|uniref:Uncharacterized protein n=1 Tax=Sinimarinibacterium flocculans TaxID=985250 RepID=A0A318E813_9GAMM|nr:hypothetical protein [Sinimarinibacterium flocculans]PXV67843.1 hypothetical protein C8D93_105200 [Sinimarinibacterium flocculans]HBG31917.1 hypothetical protein [Gammaproteobacteria bacterium]
MTVDTLPFAVQLTADRKYINVRIPVESLPAELRRRPSAMNVRLLPERPEIKNQPWRNWVPDYLLALAR